MSTTAAPILRGDWVPNNQAICLRTDDVWQWDYGIPEDMRTVVGAPSQTTECLPGGWGSDVTYEGTKCPPRYTKACQATENSLRLAVVCCPTIHDFVCPAESNLETAPHASIFRCVSQYTDTGTWTLTRTFMTAAASTTVLTPGYDPSIHLFALGIIYATPTSVCVCHILQERVSLARNEAANSPCDQTTDNRVIVDW